MCGTRNEQAGGAAAGGAGSGGASKAQDSFKELQRQPAATLRTRVHFDAAAWKVFKLLAAQLGIVPKPKPAAAAEGGAVAAAMDESGDKAAPQAAAAASAS